MRRAVSVAQGIEAAQADETRSGSAEGESPTRRDAPPSLPPTGEGLPEEVDTAINEAIKLAMLYGNARVSDRPPFDRAYVKARSTLDATILHHLSAARAERDELRASVQKMHRRCQSSEADLQGLVDHLRSGVDVWMKACRTAEEALSAARARAERAEKALEAAGQAADAMESVSKRLPAYSSPAELLLLHALKVRAALSSVAEEA